MAKEVLPYRGETTIEPQPVEHALSCPVMPDKQVPSTMLGNGIALYFTPGSRPSVEAIGSLIEAATDADIMARITHRPPPEEGWVELLASGLTFDLTGLSPAEPAAPGEILQRHGFDDAPRWQELEAVDLSPGGHIAGGAGLLPVIRTMAGLAASLSLKLPVAAVGWRSAQTLMEPRYFAQIIVNWLSGGAFPALGLTALLRSEDGSISTRGLLRFAGREMLLEGAREETPSETLKLAIRVVDYLVRQGSFADPRMIDSPRGRLLLEPSQAGKQIWVWRQH